MIRGAEIRKQASDLEKFKAAYYVFRDKYAAIPGDMANPQNFLNSTDLSTIYGWGWTGNNNGFIDNWAQEPYLAQFELNAAGLTPYPRAGGWLPAIDGSQIYFYVNDLYAQVTPKWRNAITIFNPNPPAWANAGVLTGDDARRLDSKIDDGKPQSGTVEGALSWWGGATTYPCADAVLTNTYGNLTDTDTKRCRIIYWLD